MPPDTCLLSSVARHSAPPTLTRIATPAPPPDAATLPGVSSGPGVAVLDDITRPEVGMTLWQRTLAPDLAGWLSTLRTADLPGVRLLLRPEDWPAAAAQAQGPRHRPGSARAALMDDIGALIAAFARIAGCERVDVRLEWVGNNACWKFHRDAVAARLVTTYRGPGTEWVPPDSGARALAQQRGYDGPLHRMPAGTVALFKGSCADGCHGIVHRSPPIAGTRVKRLFLCLNAPSAASPPPWDGGDGWGGEGDPF